MLVQLKYLGIAGDEALAAHTPAPAAPEVIIFSFLFFLFCPFASHISLTEEFGLRSSYSVASVWPRLIRAHLDYVGACSICVRYILEILDYIGTFSVCVTYIIADIRLRWHF